ncbi:MAG: hypothetical protein JSW66_17060 [Phycisphaerales bacterium]|nr:MAG: hypothetical protein JSW66_17060 [Phycisphaerales bacterium]
MICESFLCRVIPDRLKAKDACRRIPGIRFKAVCEIWATWTRKRVSRVLKAYRHEHNTYVDYREMLDKEKDLDAVIVATPDFWHAPHAVL